MRKCLCIDTSLYRLMAMAKLLNIAALQSEEAAVWLSDKYGGAICILKHRDSYFSYSVFPQDSDT